MGKHELEAGVPASHVHSGVLNHIRHLDYFRTFRSMNEERVFFLDFGIHKNRGGLAVNAKVMRVNVFNLDIASRSSLDTRSVTYILAFEPELAKSLISHFFTLNSRSGN